MRVRRLFGPVFRGHEARRSQSAGLDDGPSAAPGAIQAVVGLGNPGRRYAGTRHNIGFDVVARLLRDRSAKERWFPGGLLVEVEIAGRTVPLLRPTGYMNRSGSAVRRMLESDGLTPNGVLVVCDDFVLPLGAIRFRRRGSDGGHNGLGSILRALGTKDFPRVRLGVGAPSPRSDPSEHVLSPFRTDEAEAVEDLVARSAEAIETALGSGLETAMNRFNRTPS